MNVKVSFAISQAIRSLKSYVYLIIGISLSVSLLLGIFNYIDSVSMYNLEQSLPSAHDYLITYNGIENRTDIYDRFGNNESLIIQELENSKLKIEGVNPYAEFRTTHLKFQQNSSIGFYMSYYGDNFYSSARFRTYFTVIEGRVPQAENEYLVDAWTALKLNLSIADNTTFFLRADSGAETVIEEINWTNIAIVGYYVPNYEEYEISDFTKYSAEVPYTPEFNMNLLNFSNEAQGPFFGYFDIHANDTIHPINLFLNNLETDEGDPFDLVYTFDYGIGVDYDRSSIRPMRIRQTIYSISLDRREFEYYAEPIYSISFRGNMESDLARFSDEFMIARLSFLVLIIPLVIFTISLGNFVMNSNFNSRNEEFGRYRMKGYPKGMIISQLLFESLFIGISAFLLAIFLSMAVFYLLQPMLNSYYVIVSLVPKVIPWRLNLLNYLTSLGFAIGISILGNILTFIKIARLKIGDMYSGVKSLDLEIGYDENMFDSPENGEKQKKKKRKSSIYLDQTKLMEKSIPKISIYFILGAFIPFIAIFVRYLGYLPGATDQLHLVATGITRFMKIVLVFAWIAPIALVYGLLRFFIQESPQRYAKICRLFAKPLLKDHDYLAGLEMLRRKPYILVIFVLGLFSTSLVFGNIGLYSQLHEFNFYQNVNIASDINITINGTAGTGYYSNSVYQNITYTEMDAFNESLSQLKDEFGNTIVQNQAFLSFQDIRVYYEDDYWDSDYLFSTREIMCATNLNAYLSVVNEEIFDAFGSVKSAIQNLISYREGASNASLGVIMNNRLLEHIGYEVGDEVDLNYQYNLINSTVFSVYIVDSFDFLPSISKDTYPLNNYYNPSPFDSINYNEEGVVIMDFEDVPQNDSFFITKAFATLIKCNTSSNYQSSFIQTAIDDIASDFSRSIRYNNRNPTLSISYYDHDWANVKFSEITDDSMLSNNLLYINLVIIGVLIAFAITTTIVGLEKKNLHFEGLLLSKGFGKKKIFLMITSQIFTIFLFSIIIGVFSGLITGWVWIESYLGTKTHISWNDANLTLLYRFPFSIKLPEIGLILLFNFVLTVILYSVFFIIQERKSISRLLIKF